jgi:hypothetical protein
MVEVHIFPVKYTKTLSRDALDYRNVMKRQFCGEKTFKTGTNRWDLGAKKVI